MGDRFIGAIRVNAAQSVIGADRDEIYRIVGPHIRREDPGGIRHLFVTMIYVPCPAKTQPAADIVHTRKEEVDRTRASMADLIALRLVDVSAPRLAVRHSDVTAAIIDLT